MKKRKLIRNVSLVALSAVMVCGTAVAFAGCKKKADDYTLTVNIFCDQTDKATNDQICQTWAAEYTEKLRAAGTIPADKEVHVDFNSDPSRDAYFEQLNTDFVRGKAADIIYVQPKNVKSWARRGRIMDLSEFINNATGDAYDQNVASIQGLWQDVLAFYGYSQEAEAEGTYSMGDSLQYYKTGETIGASGKTAEHGGFYTTGNATEVGVYGLPKDYSNFTMGFNGRYFSEALKLAYMTVPVNTARSVTGAADNPAKNTYTGTPDADVVTYAVDGDYKITNPFDGTEITMHAEAGSPAPLINPGVPTRYKPYNFYAFPNFNAALTGGDPVARAVQDQTGEEGYIVTIPGFPGDTFEVPDGTAVDANAPYDTNIGHITLTYAEYGALTWAVTYFCNTFNFGAIQDATSNNFVNISNGKGTVTSTALTSGKSGVLLGFDNATPENVFGNDQYEGAPNPTLYLLPWLAGNDANFINTSSDVAINATAVNVTNDGSLNDGEYDFKGIDIREDGRLQLAANQQGGTYTEQVPKRRLNGNIENVDVQYGVNSQNFIETFGAFLAYGSDWNGNSGNSRTTDEQKTENGWSLFRNGACIFYGAGTWDNKTKNESPMTIDGKTICEWRSMTVPVGEKYALYSNIKNAYYQMEAYQWDSANDTKAANATLPSAPYTQEQIIANQLDRQDKWGARMDSVGFALNDQVRVQAESSEAAAWKLQGAADLILTLSAQEKSQHDLTLGGAQLPNFKQQCEDFLYYQDPVAENVTDAPDNAGAFSDMITPEGFSDTEYWTTPGLVKNPAGVAEAETIWKAYGTVVEALNTASDANSTELKMTIQNWFQAHYPNGTIPGYQIRGGDVPLRWDEQFANQTIEDVLTGELARRAAAMKILKMTAYTYADRDMQLRMQYGLNAIRDSAMYTYEVGWINDISMRDGTSLTYRVQAPFTSTQSFESLVTTAINTPVEQLKQYYSPAFFCFFIAGKVQEDLETSIKNEIRSYSQS